jgi:hypothetical protein
MTIGEVYVGVETFPQGLKPHAGCDGRAARPKPCPFQAVSLRPRHFKTFRLEPSPFKAVRIKQFPFKRCIYQGLPEC